MITNPKYGWCNFELGNFKGTPSCLTDVTVDLLEAFIEYHTKGMGAAWFDEEGAEFTLVITPYSLFIIEEKDKPVLHDFSEMQIDKLEKELIDDIEKDLDGWSEFIISEDREEILAHGDEIIRKIDVLKEMI